MPFDPSIFDAPPLAGTLDSEEPGESSLFPQFGGPPPRPGPFPQFNAPPSAIDRTIGAAVNVVGEPLFDWAKKPMPGMGVPAIGKLLEPVEQAVATKASDVLKRAYEVSQPEYDPETASQWAAKLGIEGLAAGVKTLGYLGVPNMLIKKVLYPEETAGVSLMNPEEHKGGWQIQRERNVKAGLPENLTPWQYLKGGLVEFLDPLLAVGKTRPLLRGAGSKLSEVSVLRKSLEASETAVKEATAIGAKEAGEAAQKHLGVAYEAIKKLDGMREATAEWMIDAGMPAATKRMRDYYAARDLAASQVLAMGKRKSMAGRAVGDIGATARDIASPARRAELAALTPEAREEFEREVGRIGVKARAAGLDYEDMERLGARLRAQDAPIEWINREASAAEAANIFRDIVSTRINDLDDLRKIKSPLVFTQRSIELLDEGSVVTPAIHQRLMETDSALRNLTRKKLDADGILETPRTLATDQRIEELLALRSSLRETLAMERRITRGLVSLDRPGSSLFKAVGSMLGPFALLERRLEGPRWEILNGAVTKTDRMVSEFDQKITDALRVVDPVTKSERLAVTKGSAAEGRIFAALDEADDAARTRLVHGLGPDERIVHDRLRGVLDEWADLLNMPERGKYLKGYLPHLWGDVRKSATWEISPDIGDARPLLRYVHELERKGAKGYRTDLEDILRVYNRRTINKAVLEPAYTTVTDMINLGTGTNAEALKWQWGLELKLLKGQPTSIDELSNALLGFLPSRNPIAVTSQILSGLLLRGTIGGGLGTAGKNIAGNINTLGRNSILASMRGLLDYTTKQGWKRPEVKQITKGFGWERMGEKGTEVKGLLTRMAEDYPQARRAIHAIQAIDQKVLMKPMAITEDFNRGLAWHIAYSQAMREKLPAKEALRFAQLSADEANFTYRMIDRMPISNINTLRPFFVLSSWPVKQADLLVNLFRTDPVGLLRWTAMSGFLSRQFANMGQDPSTFLGLGFVPGMWQVSTGATPMARVAHSTVEYIKAVGEGDADRIDRTKYYLGEALLSFVPGSVAVRQFKQSVDAIRSGEWRRGYASPGMPKPLLASVDDVQAILLGFGIAPIEKAKARRYFDEARRMEADSQKIIRDGWIAMRSAESTGDAEAMSQAEVDTMARIIRLKPGTEPDQAINHVASAFRNLTDLEAKVKMFPVEVQRILSLSKERRMADLAELEARAPFVDKLSPEAQIALFEAVDLL